MRFTLPPPARVRSRTKGARRALIWRPAWFAFGFSLLFLSLQGCGGDGSRGVPPEQGEGGRLRAAASIPPLKWGFDALGSTVEAEWGAELLLDPGASPHDAALTPSRARALASADLVLLVGWDFEPQLERALRGGTVLRMSEVLARAGIHPPPLLAAGQGPDTQGHPHAHGAENPTGHGPDSDPPGAHAHSGVDPHAWLDPLAMAAWVEALGQELGIAESRVQQVLSEIAAVHAEYEAALGSVRTRTLVTHHEGWGWLARRYGLEVAAVLRPEGIVETRPGDLNRAVAAVRDNGLGVVFSERQIADRSVQRLADLTGTRILTLDPLGDGDWPTMMRRNLTLLVEGLNALPERGTR